MSFFQLNHITKYLFLQAWSITYHSLLTLIYLLWACLLWVLPNSRKWCLRMSPFFTIYGGLLLILQYLCGFKIGFDQLSFLSDRHTMEQIGIKINDYHSAFISSSIKVCEFVRSFYFAFGYFVRQTKSDRENNYIYIYVVIVLKSELEISNKPVIFTTWICRRRIVSQSFLILQRAFSIRNETSFG